MAINEINTDGVVNDIKYVRVIVALALSGLIELASLFFIQPLLPGLSINYHVPVQHVSIIMSAKTAFMAIGLLFTGSLADYYGRKQVIIGSLLTGCVLTLLCPLVQSWAMLVLIQATTGLALCGIAAAATAYISEEVAPVAAGIVTGYFVFGNSIGGMSGRIVASQLMDHVSIDAIFYGFAVCLFAAFVVVSFLLPASKNFTPTKNLNVLRVVKEGASHFSNKNLVLAFIISFIIFGVFTSLYNYLAFFLKGEPFNISPAYAGLLSFSFALSFFTAPQAGRLSAKYGSMRILSALLIAMAVGMLLTLVPNVYVFILGSVIFTASFFGCHSVGLSWVSKNATYARGQAVALYLFSYYMGGAVVGFLSGYIFHSLGWKGMTAFIVILLAFGVLISTYLGSMQKTSATLITAENK
ncbi:TPA: MFS transporter [Klebsiella aerogenes]|uniref:MFS transporter n=1 Tax=Klebsiella aerogenes TaxID=548 RepID=UPI00291C34D6|nr:MFS transporter [Klebsiella aerogenes]MDU9142961.1 MFS transporter [Klebsiella aerogenes]